jgi:hypothetical protein
MDKGGWTLKKLPRIPFKPFSMGHQMIAKKPQVGDKSMTRKVYMLSRRREVLVGYIFLPDPKVMRYAFKTNWMDHPSTERFKTLREAKDGLGAKL